MKLRPATRADLEQVMGLWNLALGARFPLREAILGLILFDDPELADAVVAEDANHRIIGAGWCKRPHFLGGIVVDRANQRRGVGSAILAHLEQRLREAGARQIEISGGMLHLLPGVPMEATDAQRFFERNGYRLDDSVHVDLTHDLGAYETPPETPTATTRLARHPDEVLEFVEAAFPGIWARHARWHFAHSGRPADFVVLELAGRTEGFCQIVRPDAWPAGPSTYWATAPDLVQPMGGLGPIGVREAHRGYGLGRALLDASLRELQRSGVRSCVIDWTRLLDFYGRFGFRVWRRYRRGPPKPLWVI